MNTLENLSGMEVIRAAMEVERQGQRFYAEMRDTTEDPALAELFSELARDEVQHLQRLMEYADRFRDETVAADEEFLPFVEGFAADRIFPDTERLEEAMQHPDATVKVLDLAIEAEERFAAYLREAEASARNDDGRQAFAWLAAEEARHAALIRARKAALADS